MNITGGDNRLGPAVRAAFHPIALSLAYVLSSWLETNVSLFAVGRALLVAPVVALLFLMIGYALLRDVSRAGLFASGLLLFVIAGREAWLVVAAAVSVIPVWQTALLLTLLCALATAAYAIGHREGLQFPSAARLTRILDVTAGAILLVVVASGVAGGAIQEAIADLDQGVDLGQAPHRPDNAQLPDIYVIFLDGYPRADVLAEQYQFDNEPFLRALAQRGLDVAPASHSNYTLTQFALVSMLNVALLQDIPQLDPVFTGEVPAEPVSRRILNDNVVLDDLHQRGYTTIGLSGTYEDVALRQADIFLETGHMNETEWRLISRTFAVDIIDALMPSFFSDQQRSFVDEAFAQTARVAEDRGIGPRFMLAHVFAPHTPLVFGPHGEPVDIGELRRTDDTAAAAGLSLSEFGGRLCGELQYLNRRTLELIDTILASSEKPPIIIVMSDHGSRSVPLDPANPKPSVVRERFGTLFAALTPGKHDVFPPDVTPAQIMGLLLQAYFDFPYEPPGSGIYAEGEHHHDLIRLGDTPPTPVPVP